LADGLVVVAVAEGGPPADEGLVRLMAEITSAGPASSRFEHCCLG
jgi:hypothetical protein